ncbi:MAG: hypothetical protein ACAH80_15705 [Alphaproteobacteria bacterium]
MPKKDLITHLGKEELLARAHRMKAMYPDKKGVPHFIKPCDIQTKAFTWDPVLTEPAKGLTELESIVTYHNSGAPSFFKPDISEVLAQIPPHLVGQVTAFMTESDSAQQFSEGGSHHRAITRLFTGELPDSVKAYPVIYNGQEVFPPPPAPPQPVKGMHPITLKPPGK